MMDHLSLVPYDGAGGGGGGDAAGGKYKECMRNHAAAMGGQAFDGCGEYMASSPDTLKCAACGCHRSFHRRALAAAGPCAPPVFFRPPPPPALPAPPQQHFHHHHHHQAALQGFLPSVPVPVPAPPPHLALPYHAVPNAAAAPPWLAARAGSETPPRLDDFGVGVGVGLAPGSGAGSGSFGRKRFRTKFTPEQKERMREFAEKQGWRIQRNDDGALDRFCDEIGVKRQVLKVWMHNHKNQLASNSAAAAAGIGLSPAAGAGTATGTGTGVGITGDGDDDDDDDTDDSPPRAAVSSPSPSPISV
jgi:ZF-HD class homeobox domain-containing protein